MKKILILMMMMSLLLISFASAETTILDNADNTIIGSVGGGSGLIRTITFEYNKPLGQIDNASIQLKIGKTPSTNYSIPQSCLDRSVLSFQYRVDTATFTPATTNYYCTNTSNGLELITSRNNFTGDTNTPSVTSFGEQARAYDNNYNTGVLGYNFEFFLAPTTAISNSQRADSVFYEQDVFLEHTGSLTPVCDSDITTFPCYLPSGYTWNINPGTYNINDTIWIDDGVTINGNGATLVTTSSAPLRINGSNTNINNLNINGSVSGAILIYDPASNGIINNINCDVNLYCVRFLTGGDDFDVTNINGETLIIANANDIYVNNYVMNSDIVSSVSSFSITDSTNIVVENSDFTGVDSFGDGFYIAGISSISENITLRNNVFNDVTTIYSTEFGFLGSTNIVLENNTFNSPITTSASNVDFINNNYNTNTFTNNGVNTSLFQSFGDFTTLNYTILNTGTFNPTFLGGNETSVYIPIYQALNTTAEIIFTSSLSLGEIIEKDGVRCSDLECANFYNDGAIMSFDINTYGNYERANAFTCGSGTEIDPYCIDTPQSFKDMELDLNAYYKQTNDIDFLNIAWEGLGTGTNDFPNMLHIKYDGRNYTLRNLNIVASGEHMGLFRTIDDDFVFENTNIENILLVCLSQSPSTRMGNIYGRSYGANTIQNIRIVNSTLTGQNCEKGGLAGISSGSTFNNISIENLNLGSSGRKGLVVGNGNFAINGLGIKNVQMPITLGATSGLTGYDINSGSLTNAYFENITSIYPFTAWGFSFIGGTFNNVIINNINATFGDTDYLIDSTSCNNVYYVGDNINKNNGGGSLLNPSCNATNISESQLQNANTFSGFDFLETWKLNANPLETPFLSYEPYNEFIPTISVDNISIEATIIQNGENLVGICEATTNNYETITYNYSWEVNGLPVTNSFLNPNTPIQQGGVISNQVFSNQYTFDALSNDFLYDPIVTTFKSQATCGINYRLELGDQIYQRSFGVFYVGYNIAPYSSIGNFPFTINDTYINNGEVTFNLTTQFACVTPGSYVRFEVEAQPLNSNTLDSALFESGDSVTFQCVANSGLLSANDSVTENISLTNVAPSSFNINPLLLENITGNGTIYSPFNYLTLSSTGNNIEFSYSESTGFPTPYYNVYLSNGALNYSIRSNTSFLNFIENIDRNTITFSDDYNLIVESFNSEGNNIQESIETYTFCINTWTPQYTTCVNDTQFKTYIDSSSCLQQYELPLDNGTNVVCDDQITSVEELEERNIIFKENILVLIVLLALGIGLVIFYSMSRSTMVAILTTLFFFLVSLYLFYKFPSDWILGVGSLIMSIGFGMGSLWLNRET